MLKLLHGQSSGTIDVAKEKKKTFGLHTRETAFIGKAG
jgi:hypothetical protein